MPNMRDYRDRDLTECINALIESVGESRRLSIPDKVMLHKVAEVLETVACAITIDEQSDTVAQQIQDLVRLQVDTGIDMSGPIRELKSRIDLTGADWDMGALAGAYSDIINPRLPLDSRKAMELALRLDQEVFGE